MARFAIPALTLLAAAALLSGCLAGASSAGTAAVPSPDTAPPQPAPATQPVMPDTPSCPSDVSNHGVAITIDDLYAYTGRGGNVAVLYRESNGCNGLQTEEEHPADPDTKVAEVPLPVAAAALNA